MNENKDFARTPYGGIFADLYTFLRLHYPPGSEDAFWQSAAQDAVRLSEKYQSKGEMVFFNQLLEATMYELARVAQQ